MKLLTLETQWRGGNTVVAFGMFDGVHMGHARLMQKANELAALHDLTSVVYTFSSHPMQTYAPERMPPQLDTRSERIRSIARMGIDVAVLRPFNREYARQTPEEFVRTFCEALHPRHVVVGFNYSFGCRGAGKAEDMIALGRKYGFETHVISEVLYEGKPVSSTRIRELVTGGRLEEAAQMLDGPYTLCGVVGRGKQLGRKLDFPTANLMVNPCKAIPARGVYAAMACVNGKWYMAAVNIGNHPTAPGGPMTVEANLIGYSGPEFYGCHMRLVLYCMLREERMFASLDELRSEVMRNREQVRQYFTGMLAQDENTSENSQNN